MWPFAGFMFIGRPPEVRLLTKTSEENRCQRSLMPSRDRLPVVPERKFCVTWIPMIEVIRNFCILVTGWQSRSVHEARPKERPATKACGSRTSNPHALYSTLNGERGAGGAVARWFVGGVEHDGADWHEAATILS